MTRLVLASGSPHRLSLLRNAGVDPEAVPSTIDERSVEAPLLSSGAGPEDVAEVLAEAKASEVATILKAVANERRLMLLCKLLDMGEANVGTLADAVGLSQSALSQHLTVLREQGIVAYRRESQTLWYRIADPRIEALFSTLQGLFCPPKDGAAPAPAAPTPAV